MIECPMCGGDCFLEVADGLMTCPACDGHGVLDEERCCHEEYYYFCEGHLADLEADRYFLSLEGRWTS